MGSYNNISLRKGPHDVQTVHCITAGAFLEVNHVPRFLVRFFSEFLATFRSMDVLERSRVLPGVSLRFFRAETLGRKESSR